MGDVPRYSDVTRCFKTSISQMSDKYGTTFLSLRSTVKRDFSLYTTVDMLIVDIFSPFWFCDNGESQVLEEPEGKMLTKEASDHLI